MFFCFQRPMPKIVRDRETPYRGIKSNSTTTTTVILPEKITNDWSCQGTYYTDPYDSWDNVVVQATLKITIMDYSATSHIQDNQISLLSGTQCSLNARTYLDLSDGYTYCNMMPQDTCHFDRYAVLYEGYANTLQDKSFQYPEIIYSVVAQDISFAFIIQERHPVCVYQLIKTPQTVHPRRWKRSLCQKTKIHKDSRPGPFHLHQQQVRVCRTPQMNSLNKDILFHRCKLQQKLLRTSQTLAIIKPDEFALN